MNSASCCCSRSIGLLHRLSLLVGQDHQSLRHRYPCRPQELLVAVERSRISQCSRLPLGHLLILLPSQRERKVWYLWIAAGGLQGLRVAVCAYCDGLHVLGLTLWRSLSLERCFDAASAVGPRSRWMAAGGSCCFGARRED
jgi:hypothetical protein